MREKRYYKSQAIFTIFFRSDFEPSIIEKILGVKASKMAQKRKATPTSLNPEALGYFQLATNIAADRETQAAVATVLRCFIKKEEEICKICKENDGYCQLDLFVMPTRNSESPDIMLSQNVIKLLADLKAKFNMILVN